MKTRLGYILMTGFAASLLSIACSSDKKETTATGPGGTPASSTAAGTGGATSSTTGSAMGGSGGTGGMMVKLDCATYCAAQEAACKGADKQYDGMAKDFCLATCAHFPPGMLGQTDGDTLGCRLYHTGAAQMGMPNVHCPHSGPLGAKACGTDQCKVFCGIVMKACTGANAAYDKVEDCEADCGGYTDKDKPFTADAADGSNTLRCRAYHLTAAAKQPDPHCKHVGGAKSKTPANPVCNK